jgi:hypothetical protein
MAEIRVEVRRRPVWPWIVAVILIIALALLWWFYMRPDGTTVTVLDMTQRWFALLITDVSNTINDVSKTAT